MQITAMHCISVQFQLVHCSTLCCSSVLFTALQCSPEQGREERHFRLNCFVAIGTVSFLMHLMQSKPIKEPQEWTDGENQDQTSTKNKDISIAIATQSNIPNATPPIVIIHPFIEIAVTFNPMMQFYYPLKFRMSHMIYFMTGCVMSICLGLAAP